MTEVRNLDGKKVCEIDSGKRYIEIVVHGCRTKIYYDSSSCVQIEHSYVRPKKRKD